MLKCYVPVPVKVGTLNKSVNFQLIRADKIKFLKDVLPSEEKITAYLRLKYGGDEKFNLETYEPLSARVSDSVFTDIIKEIRKKTNQVFVENTITIVIDSNNIPVFQLIRDNSVTID